MQTYIMIKNKVVNIKNIFKIYLKILKIGKKKKTFQVFKRILFYKSK